MGKAGLTKLLLLWSLSLARVVPLVQVNTCFALVQILSILHAAEKSICTSANTKPVIAICIEGAV